MTIVAKSHYYKITNKWSKIFHVSWIGLSTPAKLVLNQPKVILYMCRPHQQCLSGQLPYIITLTNFHISNWMKKNKWLTCPWVLVPNLAQSLCCHKWINGYATIIDSLFLLTNYKWDFNFQNSPYVGPNMM